MMYRGYTIEYQAPPIPVWCGADYIFWNDDGEKGVASSEEDAIVQIDLLLGEECGHMDAEQAFCGHCAGSGEGVVDGAFCNSCNGTGETNHLFCVDCGKHLNEDSGPPKAEPQFEWDYDHL